MKKLLTIILALMVTVYALPLITVGFEKTEDEQDGFIEDAVEVNAEKGSDKEEPGVADTSSYDEKTNITLLVGEETITINLNDYLTGVLAAEMPANFPEEALKAQAVAARTYTLYKIEMYEEGMDIPSVHKGAQLCSDPSHCKAYYDVQAKAEELWGDNADFYISKMADAVKDTDGMIATYDGKPIAAVFHAASGEKTEAAVNVWGSDIPYLVSVDSSGGEESKYYNDTVTVNKNDFANAFKEQYPSAVFAEDPSTWFRDSHRSEAGGIIDVLVGNVRVSGTKVREIAGLKSTNFTYQVDGENLIFTTTGYGHGVGMSQYGAKAMAEEGYTFDQIIKHYYTGVEIMIKS